MLLVPEKQYKRFDTMGCVSFSALSLIEHHLTTQINNGDITQRNIFWLIEKGYLKNGFINFSDRHIATLSETTTSGNWGWKVADTIVEYGLVPELKWAFLDDYDWNGYYMPIVQSVINLGLEFKEKFKIEYKMLNTLKANYPCQIFIGRTKINHAVVRLDENNFFDTYEPHYKKLDGYIIENTAFEYSIKQKSMSNAKIVRVKDSPERGYYIPSLTEDAFLSIGKNFGIEIPVDNSGKVDWEKVEADAELTNLS